MRTLMVTSTPSLQLTVKRKIERYCVKSPVAGVARKFQKKFSDTHASLAIVSGEKMGSV